jgi:hypothetical protein
VKFIFGMSITNLTPSPAASPQHNQNCLKENRGYKSL